MEFEKVKALEVDGDWFVVPVKVVVEFLRLSEALEEEGDDHTEHLRLCDEFDEKFGHCRTGGDLNLVELWRKIEE